jgi:hypothetical protein
LSAGAIGAVAALSLALNAGFRHWQIRRCGCRHRLERKGNSLRGSVGADGPPHSDNGD